MPPPAAPSNFGSSRARSTPPPTDSPPKNSAAASSLSSQPTPPQVPPPLQFPLHRRFKFRAPIKSRFQELLVLFTNNKGPLSRPFAIPSSLISIFYFPFLSLQCTVCCRASHSWLKRRTVSRNRTASAAIVSRRCSPPCGSVPSFLR